MQYSDQLAIRAMAEQFRIDLNNLLLAVHESNHPAESVGNVVYLGYVGQIDEIERRAKRMRRSYNRLMRAARTNSRRDPGTRRVLNVS